MRRFWLIVAFVFFAAIGLLLQAPASILAPLLAQATSGSLLLVDTDGTAWHGRGALSLGEARMPLAWTTDVRALLGGRLQLQLIPATGTTVPKGSIAAAPSTVEISGVEFVVPAQAAARFVPLKDLALGGDLVLAVPRLVRRGNALDGEATLAWQRARIVAPMQPAIDLGNVTLRLAGRGEELVGPIANDGGAVALAGEIALGPRRGVAGSVLATPRRADDAALVRLLTAIGQPDQGGWRIDVRAKGP